jgi:lipoprotein-anchoring transpeptidase ErfK/SrfK
VVIVREGDEDVLALPIQKVLYEYIEVKDSCGAHYEGDCLNVRAGPGGDFPVVTKLRDNVVLKVGGKVERDGTTWIKLVFDEWLRYPERVKEDWYISSAYADVVLDEGDKTTWENGNATTTKEIVIDRSEQKLYAYENDELFAEIMISTGLELTPTPRGTFTVFKKTPSRYMQGPIPGLSDQYYDLPGVPWNLYFTHDGAVIHGAYWHESFGTPYSHGCVNLPPEEARTLYLWADLGTKVTVRD